MNKEYAYTIVKTTAGWVGLAGRDGKVSSIEMPAPNPEEALSKLRAGINGRLVESNQGFEELARQLRDYFDGRKTGFNFEPDLDGLTEFQKNVLRATMTVPYGAVVSYQWIAQKAGRPRAYRAAGNALGRNPIPLAIPCHRVVGTDHKLHGFTGGLHWKVKLLELEGIRL
jgi:methylated-DNA-[protein]-cysteine S-methyltransferase